MPQPPTQTASDSNLSFSVDDYQITPLASFEITARVLAKRRYRFDRGAALAPFDFAFGWQRMSDQAVLDQMHITQGGRWYRWRAETLPIPRQEIVSSSANMHLIPANESIRRDLRGARPGDVVTLAGQLVEVAGADGYRWRSSLTRDDSGDGACELIWVERFRVEPI